MPAARSSPTHAPVRADQPRTVWLASAVVWGTVAVLASTQQWAALEGTGKAITWWQAFAWQGLSWLLLIPAVPVLAGLLDRFPLDRSHPGRLAAHFGAALVVGALFLAISVPARLAFHPSPFRWALFGEVFYKSVVPYAGAGVVAYAAALLVASYQHTRSSLRALRDSASQTLPTRLTVTTAIGTAHVPTQSLRWAEPDPSGAVLHTDDGTMLVRHRLAELEQMLAASGFVRVHRRVLANTGRVREVIGAPSRDGELRLDTGEALPVSRRRRTALDEALSRRSGKSAPDGGVPLGG